MDHQKLIKLNELIYSSYQCRSFMEFLKITILKLHELVMYESGMFFCAISKDCSFFKPYIGGGLQEHYQKEQFASREAYLKQGEETLGKEALVYKGLDLKEGIVVVSQEPRNSFLATQNDFHIVCIRIVYEDQFMGEIYLHRDKQSPDFSEEDLFVLRLLQPHISHVFHLIHTLTATNYLETNQGKAISKGLCLLDEQLSLISGNVSALTLLKMPTVFGSSVLYHIKEWYKEWKTEEKFQTLRKEFALKTAEGILNVEMLLDHKENHRIFVCMSMQNHEQVVVNNKFKFTKREADIIDGIIQGKNNAELAASIHLSENTIKTHIQSIYRKTGVKNRTELAYLLLGNKLG